jgi:hypothetical protein
MMGGLAMRWDWESMPQFMAALKDSNPEIRTQAAFAVTQLTGLDYGYSESDTPAKRAEVIKSMEIAYAAMKKNPPPKYRK